MANILGLGSLAKGFFETLAFSAKGAGTTASLIGGATGAGLKGTGKGISAGWSAFKPHKVRNSAVGLAGLGSVAGLGLAGMGPLGGIGEEYSRYATSKYGDRPETRRVISAVQGVGAAAGVGLGTLAGFGAFGKGPLAWNYSDAAKRGMSATSAGIGKGLRSAGSSLSGLNKTLNDKIDNFVGRDPLMTPFKSLSNHVNNFHDIRAARLASSKLASASRSFNNWADRTDILSPVVNTLGPVLDSAVKGVKSVVGSSGQKGNPWVMEHPFKAGLMFSMVGGAGAAVAESYTPDGYGAFEGNIVGVTNSRGQGSISPELQFSTVDLMFSLHNNNRSKRSRYQ